MSIINKSISLFSRAKMRQFSMKKMVDGYSEYLTQSLQKTQHCTCVKDLERIQKHIWDANKLLEHKLNTSIDKSETILSNKITNTEMILCKKINELENIISTKLNNDATHKFWSMLLFTIGCSLIAFNGYIYNKLNKTIKASAVYNI